MKISTRGDAMELTGDASDGFYRLTYSETLNGRGGWAIELPYSHRAVGLLAELGAGIVVQDDDGTFLFAGPVMPSNLLAQTTRVRSATDDTVTVYGVSDLSCLWWRVVEPPRGQTHGVATGKLGVAAAKLVSAQLGPAATARRRIPGWQTTAAQVGPDVQLFSRYRYLGDTVAEQVSNLGYWMEARWDAGTVRFAVKAFTATGLPISVEAGTAAQMTHDAASVTASAVYVLGEGEGLDRTIILQDCSVPWNRIELALNRGDIPFGSTDLLIAAADDAIKMGGTATEVELGDNVTVPKIGETVRVVTATGQISTVPVTESTTTITPRATETVVRVGQAGTSGLTTLIRQPVSEAFP